MLLNRGPNGFGIAPVASGDFTNIATANAADGVYTLNGSPAALGDIIDLDSPDGNFDPVVNLDAAGIKATDNGGGSYTGADLEINEPLLSSLLANGFTLVMEGFCLSAGDDPDGVSTQFVVTPHDPAFETMTYALFRCAAFTDLFAINSDEYFDSDNVILSNQVSKIAVTMTPTRMAVSINGGAVGAVESGCIDGTITNLQFSVGGGGTGRLRSFAFYEAVADADLPALSA